MRSERSFQLHGYAMRMEADVVIRSVERVRTRSGNIRYLVRDADGREFSTFREKIGEEAERYQGQRAHIKYHEEERAGFHKTTFAPTRSNLLGRCSWRACPLSRM
jgi:hypothetical protein